MQTNDPFFDDSNRVKNAAADLVKSVQALFPSGVKASVGGTSDAAIPLLLSSRTGGKLKTSDRQALLIGCGTSSNGLCALHIGRQKAVDQFLAANPTAKRTLVMRAPTNELIFWFRCEDWIPRNATTSALSWYSTGLIPLTWIDEKLDQRILRRFPVAETKFTDLQWDTESDHVFWVARQAELYGPVFRKVGPRKVVLNHSLICRIFAKDVGVVYDAVGKRFLGRDKSGNLEYLSPETLLDLFMSWLEQWANRCGTHFPVSELCLSRVQSMIQHLKLIAAAYEPDPCEDFKSYMKDRLCPMPDADVTVQEIQIDYVRYAEQSRIGRYPLCRFLRQLPKLIEEVFGVVRAHNVERWNDAEKKMTSRRGFNGLAFLPDGPDARDASDGSLEKTPDRVSN